MNNDDLFDMVIMKKDETTLSIIKEMWALSNLLTMKMRDRNQAMRYQLPKYEDALSELDPTLYRIEEIIDYEIDNMKQQIEKKKAEERDKSNIIIAANRNRNQITKEEKQNKKNKRRKKEQNLTDFGFHNFISFSRGNIS